MQACGRAKVVGFWANKIDIMGTLLRYAVLKILMYNPYISVSVLRAPCTVSHKDKFLTYDFLQILALREDNCPCEPIFMRSALSRNKMTE